MADPRDCFESTAATPTPGTSAAAEENGQGRKPYLRLWFECSRQYGRAQKSADGSHYSARCPRCGAVAKFAVGPSGTSERFFRVSC